MRPVQEIQNNNPTSTLTLRILDLTHSRALGSTRQARNFDSNSRWVPVLLWTSTTGAALERERMPRWRLFASCQLIIA